VNTTGQAIGLTRRRRRRHSAGFKAEAVAACLQPGISIAAVALARGLNANLLRRWLVEAERNGTVPVAAPPVVQSGHHFVPMPLGAAATDAVIRIELQRGSGTVVIQWPASAASECAALLRELMA
jgi:transposase